MAGSLSDTFEVDVLKAISGQATTILSTTPITPYVALIVSGASDSAAGTEATGGSYARVSSAGKWATPSAGSVANNATIQFPTATGSWGTITQFAIYDASTSGNRLAWGDLSASKTVASGDTASFASSTLTITAD